MDSEVREEAIDRLDGLQHFFRRDKNQPAMSRGIRLQCIPGRPADRQPGHSAKTPVEGGEQPRDGIGGTRRLSRVWRQLPELAVKKIQSEQIGMKRGSEFRVPFPGGSRARRAQGECAGNGRPGDSRSGNECGVEPIRHVVIMPG
jgi:hypothetical protein